MDRRGGLRRCVRGQSSWCDRGLKGVIEGTIGGRVTLVIAPVAAVVIDVPFPAAFRSFDSIWSSLVLLLSSLVMRDKWIHKEVERVAARGCHKTSGETRNREVGGGIADEKVRFVLLQNFYVRRSTSR